MSTKTLMSVCIFLLVFTVVIPNAHSEDKVSSSDILVLLNNEQYEKLDATLDRLQNKYLDDCSNESEALRAYDCFARSNPVFENKLNAWVSIRNQSAYAYVARAIYYHYLGGVLRGGKWASETSEQQFSNMEFYCNKARKDIETAMLLNQKIQKAYELIINLSNTLPNIDKKEYLDRALQIYPYSFRLRMMALQCSVPRWGGSMEEMSRIIEEARQYYPKNPKLKVLDGMLSIELGDQALYYDHNYKKALEYYNDGLNYGYSHYYLLQRADVYLHDQKHQEALKDLEIVLKENPFDFDALLGSSQCYSLLGNHAKALEMSRAAIEINPLDYSAYYWHGWANLMLCNTEAALSAFQQSNSIFFTENNKNGVQLAQSQIDHIERCRKIGFKWSCENRGCDTGGLGGEDH